MSTPARAGSASIGDFICCVAIEPVAAAAPDAGGSTSPRLRGGGAPPSPTDEVASPELEVAAEIHSLLHRARKRKLEILEREALRAIASSSVADEPTSWEREAAPSPAEAMRSSCRSPGEEEEPKDLTDEDVAEQQQQQRPQRRRRGDGGSASGSSCSSDIVNEGGESACSQSL